MSVRQSFQLPDLLSFIAPLELRANPHCRVATETSEEWITSKSNEVHLLSENDLLLLRPTKLGLLAALCFPTCDAPQLRLLTDFLSLLLYSGIRMHTVADSGYRLWERPLKFQSADIDGSQSGVDLLMTHGLLKHAVDKRISSITEKAPDTWNARFRSSVEQFYSAHEQVACNQVENITPSLDDYIQIRRDIYGCNVTLDLAELLEVFRFPEVQQHGTGFLEILRRAALDVIAWSTDVVAYQLDQSKGNRHNLVTLLMFHKNLSLQGAMNLSGSMIKDAFALFCSNEKRLLETLNSQKFGGVPILSWMWKSIPNNSREQEAQAQLEEVKRYIRALKDCIVGNIHWLYETEFFFGKKGGEVRTFGWVFVDS